MPPCDFGSPCNCRECSEMRHDSIEKCEYCDEKVDIIIDKLEIDRKGIYDFHSYGYCKEHTPNIKSIKEIYSNCILNMPSCNFRNDPNCNCRDCREMNEIRNNFPVNKYKMSTKLDVYIDISDDEEPRYIFGYCERVKRANHTYHAFDQDENKPLCKLTSIFKVSQFFRPAKNSICKKCLKHMKD